MLLAALAAVVPELVRGNSCGHDFDFHLVSWIDALQAWRSGIPYPHWTPSANFGVGEPRFVFYPPLTWMLGAALGAVLPWTVVPIALTFLLLAATGLGVRSLAREMLGEGASALAGCVAIFGGYALFTAYERTAFAELAGGLWIALLYKYALRGSLAVARKNSSPWRAVFDGSAAPLTLAVAGAWLSNPTVGVMASYLLIALALAAAWIGKTWAFSLRAFVALPLGLGLTAVYLAPVAGEQHWADLNQVNLSPGQTLENNWLFARHADPVLAFHDEVLHQVSLIAVVMVLVTLSTILFCWLRRRLPGDRRWWLPLALIPVAVLLLQLPLTHMLWNLLPKLRYLQFPWRWLVVLEAPMGIFVAAALWPRTAEPRWPRWLLGALACSACAVILLGANRSYFQGCADEDSVPGMLATLHSGLGYRGVDEYVPPGADNSLVAENLPDACLADDPLVELGAEQTPPADFAPDDDLPPRLWTPVQAGCRQTFSALAARAKDHAEHFEVRGEAGRAGFLILKLHRYPAWQVRVNGVPANARPVREDGLLAVPVPRGAFTLAADWRTTPDVWLGRALSCVSVLLLTALFFLERVAYGSDKIRRIWQSM